MRVILQENVANLGNVGDQVTVKRGYGRNYLIPLNKAVPATAENVVAFEKSRGEFEKKAAAVLASAKQRAEKLEKMTVTVDAQAGDEGKLFGSIGPRDVADAITHAGVAVAKSEVCMPQGPIRQIGEYTIELQLHSEVMAKIQINVKSATSQNA